MKTISNSNKNLILFFVITLAWTWGFGFAPVVMGIEGTPLGTFLFYFGGGAPSVTALFLVFLPTQRKKKKTILNDASVSIIWGLNG